MEENPEVNSDYDPDEEEEEQEDPDELGKALIKASAGGDTEQVLDLLKRKADPNYLDKKSWTPLIWAASQGQKDVVKILLDNKAKTVIYKENEEGETEKITGNNPLHWASFNGHTKVVWYLMKENMDPMDVDVYGNNCIHHAVAGARHDILEVFLAFGVSVIQRNSRGHSPLDLATEPQIRDMIVKAEKAKKCTKCGQRFDIYNNRHLCQVCRRYFCSNDKTITWVFENAEDETPEKPVCRCQECLDYLSQIEREVQGALNTNVFEKVDRAFEMVESSNVEIDVKIVKILQIARERLKTEGEIRAFIQSLAYVENYKTILKSVHVLQQMVKDAADNGVQVDPMLLDLAEKECNRLTAERNLRYNVSITPVSNATEDRVSELEALTKTAIDCNVANEYVETAQVLIQRMQDNINSHYILRLFLDYPVREYPEPEPPQKAGARKAPAQQEQKKAPPRRRKKEPKFIIPDWAGELQALMTQVEALERLIKQADELGLNEDFLEQANENIVRMKKEIGFRRQQEEEAKEAAEKRAAARRAAAKKQV